MHFVTAEAEENMVPIACGAPLPPVEITIDAERVEVSAGVTESKHEGAFRAVNIVQQLRGSAPYIDLHHDSNMVVHICISSAPVLIV